MMEDAQNMRQGPAVPIGRGGTARMMRGTTVGLEMGTVMVRTEHSGGMETKEAWRRRNWGWKICSCGSRGCRGPWLVENSTRKGTCAEYEAYWATVVGDKAKHDVRGGQSFA